VSDRQFALPVNHLLRAHLIQPVQPFPPFPELLHIITENLNYHLSARPEMSSSISWAIGCEKLMETPKMLLSFSSSARITSSVSAHFSRMAVF
jgi:hypothetical protein